MRIKRLPLHEIQKIAAGEVVERPANIVKELLENALDAGATAIVITLEEGGKKYISVADNGCGMSPDDALMAVEHHATSKISSVNDLETIATFGFRGEALSSISAISTFTLRTKEAAADAATQLVFQAGALVRSELVAAQTGTTIIADDIFATIPARKKFLKTTETELRAIQHIVTAYALAYPAVALTLVHEGNAIVQCPAPLRYVPAEHSGRAGSDFKPLTLSARLSSQSEDGCIEGVRFLRERVAHIFGVDHARTLLECSAHDENATMTGLVGTPTLQRYDRSGLFLWVNNRFVKNPKIITAAIKGFEGMLPPGKYPVGYFFITIDSFQIDVNIHPRKEEILFVHPKKIEALMTSAVRAALKKHFSIAQDFPVPVMPTRQNFTSAWQAPHRSYTPPISAQSSISQIPVHVPEQLSEQFSGTILGQYAQTYIVVQKGEDLQLIDQHAAHERVLYNLFAKHFGHADTVQLLFPQTVTLAFEDAEIIQKHAALFAEHGILLERFGDREILVRSVPVHLKNAQLSECISEFVSWLAEDQSAEDKIMRVHEKMRAKMACTAAVKAGDMLSPEQQRDLIMKLEQTEPNLTCPHGRPTRTIFTLAEIEKLFKRRN